MTNGEAKFILSAYRPGGQDARDSLFADALAQARRDPELGVWFKGQIAFDASVSATLREIIPPPGLREMILVGARVSSPIRARRRWFWLTSAAAAMAVLLGVARVYQTKHASPDIEAFTRFALHDTAFDGMHHLGSVATIKHIEEQLAVTNFRSAGDLNVNLARLRADGCRTVRVAGREVFEICFGSDHGFHLYLAQRDDFTVAKDNEPKFATVGRFSAATWADSRLAYTLVTSAGVNALRQRF